MKWPKDVELYVLRLIALAHLLIIGAWTIKVAFVHLVR